MERNSVCNVVDVTDVDKESYVYNSPQNAENYKSARRRMGTLCD
jgi:hypothetical protein